jgi:hypothetical protein
MRLRSPPTSEAWWPTTRQVTDSGPKSPWSLTAPSFWHNANFDAPAGAHLRQCQNSD